MTEPRTRMRTAERVAGVVAMIAALVVLNGAWVNQHSFQNVSWRVAVAALLVLLMVIVETNAFGLLRSRVRDDDAEVPEFLRAGSQVTETLAESESAHSETVGAGERT